MREKDWFTKCIVFLNNLIVHISTILITFTNRLHDIFYNNYQICYHQSYLVHMWDLSLFYLFMFLWSDDLCEWCFYEHKCSYDIGIWLIMCLDAQNRCVLDGMDVENPWEDKASMWFSSMLELSTCVAPYWRQIQIFCCKIA